MNELEQRIHAEITQNGGIPFRRFMEIALYEPGLGYYETHREVGRAGDFYTSVSVGRLYGELLAFQFANWLEEIEGPVQLVEAGAHDGRLARDVLIHLREWRPAIFERCELVLWEASLSHREWQEQTLGGFGANVIWLDEAAPFRGVFYSNELLDACPVDRYVWNQEQQAWNLSMVKSRESQLTLEVEPEPRRFESVEKYVQAGAVSDGFVLVRGTNDVWEQACGSLREGRAFAVDYWRSFGQCFGAPAPNGTLRGYEQHRTVDNVLDRPGEIDITASVIEEDIVSIASRAGLECEPLVPQANFLVGIFEQTTRRPELFPEWTEERTRQFQTLVHPEHLGRSFQVLECWRG